MSTRLRRYDARRYPHVIVPAHTIRLTHRQWGDLMSLLSKLALEAETPEFRRKVKAVLLACPTRAPYDVVFTAAQWPYVSMALRMNLPAVTDPAALAMLTRGRSLYTYLIKRGYGRVAQPRVPSLRS